MFLVVLGIMVCMMNKAGGSAAFGEWAGRHIKTRVGAQLVTVLLGILIFDDPFVNLDDNNIKGAMKLLDEIAKNYQVIYFTCSESRIHN